MGCMHRSFSQGQRQGKPMSKHTRTRMIYLALPGLLELEQYCHPFLQEGPHQPEHLEPPLFNTSHCNVK